MTTVLTLVSTAVEPLEKDRWTFLAPVRFQQENQSPTSFRVIDPRFLSFCFLGWTLDTLATPPRVFYLRNQAAASSRTNRLPMCSGCLHQSQTLHV